MAAKAKRPEIIELSRGLRGIPQCEDYERMISGMMFVYCSRNISLGHLISKSYVQVLMECRYNPNTPQLLEARHHCRGLTQDYNNFDVKSISYEQVFEKRLELLRKVCGKVGDGTFVEPPFRPDYGCNIIIGSNCFINWK